MSSPDVWTPRLGYLPDPAHPFNKQWDIFNTRRRIVLVDGSRKSGKTWAVLHRVARHLWETPGARVAVFAKSVKLAKDGGSWQELVERTIPEWCDGDFGFKFTTFDADKVGGPKTDSITKTPYFRIRNYYGGESEARLYSIDNDDEVASKVKNKSFSMIWFVELSMFKDPRILSVTLPSLRMPHLRPPHGKPDTYHQWIGDTNPDEDLGNRSWFYKVFYEDRTKAHVRQKNESDDDYQERQEYYASMEVITMFMKDNPFITRQEVIELKMSCRDDQGLFDSYVLGIHGDGGQKRTKHFAGIFNPQVHVVGAIDGDDSMDTTSQIYVNKNTTLLHSGWDIGSTSNHAAGIVDIWTSMVGGVERSNFSVLDEVTSFDERIKIEDFAREFTKKMDFIEKRNNRKYDWTHWSDDTALNVWRPISGTFDYLEIMRATDNRVVLQGVFKPEGSVKTRVRLLRRLLREERIFVSARCVRVIAMLEECRKGDSEKDFVLWDEHKHTFDWLTYIIFMELLAELQEENQGPKVTHESAPIAVG